MGLFGIVAWLAAFSIGLGLNSSLKLIMNKLNAQSGFVAIPKANGKGLDVVCRQRFAPREAKAILAWHGGRFVQMEREFGSMVLNNLPAWILEAIIPVSFGLIAYRYAVFFFKHLNQLLVMRGEQ